MTRHFTQYWRNETWDLNRYAGHQGSMLDHTAGNGFRALGVSAGDHVYIVTIRSGKLYLLCRGTVDRVTDQRGAATALKTSPDMLWEATDHLLLRAEEAAREDYDREVPGKVTRNLTMLRADGPKPLSLKADGRLDQQALRGVCELTPQAAALLDTELGIDALVSEPERIAPETAKTEAKKRKTGKIVRRTSTAALATEREFEQNCIQPMLARWGVTYQAQYTHRYRHGSSPSSMIIDYLVSDQEGHLTLLENKRRLSKPTDLEKAVEQALFYARTLALPSFIVSAPDGLWLYRLWHDRQILEKHCAVAELSQHDVDILRILREVRAQHGEPPPSLRSITPGKAARGSLTTNKALVLDPPPPGLEIHTPQATAVLDAMVLHAVDVRGPVNEVLLRRLVRDAWGLARSGSRVQHAVGASIMRLKRRKQIQQTPAGDLIRSEHSSR